MGSLSESDGHDEDWIGYSRGRGESEREVAEDIDERLESTAKFLGRESVATLERKKGCRDLEQYCQTLMSSRSRAEEMGEAW